MNLNFLDFDKLEVSTKTYTAQPNFRLNLDKLIDIIPIYPCVLQEKKRGRKKQKGDTIDPFKDIPHGSIISAKYKDTLKGVNLKTNSKKKETTSATKTMCMRNSMSIDIVLDKRINFKIYCNGTFQLTGCKTYNHASECIRYIWKIVESKPSVYTYVRGDTPEIIIVPAMRNLDFKLGFNVDREKMLLQKPDFDKVYCYLDTCCSYIGMTLKIPLDKDITTMETIKMKLDNDNWVFSNGVYKEYLDNLPIKSKHDKLKQKHYNTFLIFYSGTTVMSGLSREYMRDAYYKFINLIQQNYTKIVENIDYKEPIDDGLSD